MVGLLALCAASTRVGAHPHTGLGDPAHVHEPLGLEISISADGVVFQVLLSNGYFNLLIPQERGRLKLARHGEQFVFLDPQQEARERDAFATLFIDYAPTVTIDGIPAPAAFERLDFLPSVDPYGITDHTLAPPDARVVLRCPAPAPPRRVTIEWTLYPTGMSRDPFGQARPPELAAKLDAGGQSRIVKLTPDAPVMTWEAEEMVDENPVAPVQFEKIGRPAAVIPLCSVALMAGWLVLVLGLRGAHARPQVIRAALLAGVAVAGGAYATRSVARYPVGVAITSAPAAMDATRAEKTFTALLGNVYRAFDYTRESDIYDVLARSVDGAQLEAIYNEVYQSLIAREQGGAVSRVKDIDVITVQLAEDIGESPAERDESFAVRCRWRVNGIVYHWGHMHRRTNEYKAMYTVSRRGDAWKITGCELLGQRRLGGPGGVTQDPPAAERSQP